MSRHEPEAHERKAVQGTLVDVARVTAPARASRREIVAFVLALALPLAGLLVFLMARSLGQGVDRALGQGFVEAGTRVSASLSRTTTEDFERFLRAAGATLDLVSPPERGNGPQPLRRLFDSVGSAARRELRQEGVLDAWLLDQIIEGTKRDGAVDPADPERLTDLAMGLMLKLRDARSREEAAELAVRAEEAFDRALVKGSPWRSRFARAALGYLSPVDSDRRDEALRRFQALIDEQTAGPPRADLALAYLFLGNLHFEEGSREEAQAVWKRGLALFPASGHLARRLADFEENPGGGQSSR